MTWGPSGGASNEPVPRVRRAPTTRPHGSSGELEQPEMALLGSGEGQGWRRGVGILEVSGFGRPDDAKG